MTVIAKGINSRSWMEMEDSSGLAFSLSRLEGNKFFSLALWRLPEGIVFEGSNPCLNSNTYLQAGGSAERMAIEIRRIGAHGQFVQYCVGRSAQSENQSWEVVSYGDQQVRVRSFEVFDAASALPIFEEYFRTGELHSDCVLRQLSL